MDRKLISKKLNNDSNFFQSFCELKAKLKIKDYFVFLGFLSQKKQCKDFINNLFPKKIENILSLKNVPLLYYSDIYKEDLNFCNERELYYFINLILFYKNRINSFCCMRDKFEKAIMYSRYEEAENVLTQIYNAVGYSFWYLEAKLLLIELTQGSLLSGEFCNQLDVSSDLRIIKEYAFIIRDRVSFDINQRLFNERFKEHYEALIDENNNFTNVLSDYFKYSCYERVTLKADLLRNLLAAASHLSLIDTYVLLEKLISKLVSSEVCNNRDFIKSDFVELIEEMANSISWVGWNNILVLFGKNEFLVINEEKLVIHKALKLFCEKKEDECIAYCLHELKTYSNNLSLINILAKCNALVPDLLLGKIVNILKVLYLKNVDNYEFNSLVTQCTIYIRVFSSFSFGNGLSVLMEQEMEPSITNFKTQYINSLINYNFTPSKLAFFLPENTCLPFIENYRNTLSELYFCDWQMATYEELRSDLAKYFIMDDVSNKIINLMTSNNQEVIQTCGSYDIESEDLKDRVYNSLLIRTLFDTFVNEKKYLDAINTYLTAHFVSKVMVRKIDFSYLNQKLTYTVRESLESYMEYCVYIHITEFGKNFNEIISEEVMSSFKMVLRRIGLDRPSNIIWPDKPSDKRLLCYFWFNICIRETISRLLPPFYIQTDINDERLKIIEKLLNYYLEIGDTRDLSYLKDEKHKIEKEKDLANINSCLNRGKINLNAINYRSETDDALVLAVDRGVNCKAILEDGTIDNKYFAEFKTAFDEVRRNYSLEIDRIISVNIRHGILENEIIRYFKKKGLSSKYEDDQLVKKDLKSFFSDIYKLIDKLNDEYIWASYEKKLNGISFYYEDELLQFYASKLIEVKSPDDLKRVCIAILETKLENELLRLGNIIYEKLYYEITRLLDEKIIFKNSVYANQAMQCKDALEYELCKVRDWFSFSQNFAEQYKFSAWIEQLKEDYPYIVICSNAPDTFMLTSSQLSDMDILFHNLILNIFKHSGFEEDDSLLDVVVIINYQKTNTGNIINIKLSNSVSPFKDKEDLLADVEGIKMLINQKGNELSILEERKTGYKKIIRLLNRNYSDKWSLNPFYDNENKKFIVELVLKYEEKDGESIIN